MEQLTTTPFGRRPVTAALLERAKAHQDPPALPHADKWELFRNLCTARLAFGVTDRELTVLNALLSFHPDANLSDNASLIVFPSNAALSERAHGMAESTLRRHLAGLVQAGLIARHDSPNGKRYAKRDAEGGIARAFGFDLRPLLVRSKPIAIAAAEATAAKARLSQLREDVSLLKRDVVKLAEYGEDVGLPGDWAPLQLRLREIHKLLRRKPDFSLLEDLKAELSETLAQVHRWLSETKEMSGNDACIERHHHNSNTDSPVLECPKELGTAEPVSPQPQGTQAEKDTPTLPLFLVTKACPDIVPYADGRIRDWRDLVTAASFIRGMMGISRSAWEEAQRIMGPATAAIVVAGILQRVSEIRSPGGYLRALTRKAETTGFSPGPMIMALLTPKTS